MTSRKPRWHKLTGTGIHDPAMHMLASSECNWAVASYQDSGKHRVTFPRRDRHRSKEGHMPVNPCVLDGSTRRHFPIRKATKNKQLGVGYHTYKIIQSTSTCGSLSCLSIDT